MSYLNAKMHANMRPMMIAILFTVGVVSTCVAVRAAKSEINIDLNTFRQQSLTAHNDYRSRHISTGSMQLTSELNDYAQAWAVKIAAMRKLQHSGGPYGENLYWSSGFTPTGDAPVTSWYDEIKYYDYSRPGFSAKTGHFTQVVWKSSTQLGVGAAQASDGSWYVVGSYKPPGNYQGQFPQNVMPVAECCSSQYPVCCDDGCCPAKTVCCPGNSCCSVDYPVCCDDWCCPRGTTCAPDGKCKSSISINSSNALSPLSNGTLALAKRKQMNG